MSVMRKVWLLILSFGLVAFGYYFTTHYLFYSISLRGLVPAIHTPSNDIKEYLPQNQIYAGPISVRNNLQMDIFAELDGSLPRVLEFDPSGTLVVSSTNKGKILALPDKDGDGKADSVVEIESGLNKPHGIAFDVDYIYVAETNAVSRYLYNSSAMSVGAKQKLFDLPGGGGHFTRTIKIYGGKLYTSVGSSCNSCAEEDWRRASILVSDLDGANLHLFAKGLRNTVFFTFDNQGRMWGADMGRDNLGDNLPPDEINLIQEGKDYGWPYCYGNRVRDSKFKPGTESTYCVNTEPPVYSLPAHVAPLGLTFINNEGLGQESYGNLLVAEHGSWNSSVKVGYQIVELSFFADQISNENVFVSGFLKNSDIMGRPVGLAIGSNGYLYVSDDYAGLVYIIGRRR